MLRHSASSGFDAQLGPSSSSLRLAPWACAARDIPPRPRQTRCVGGPQPPSCPHSGRADLIRAASAGARPMRASHSLEEAAHAPPGPSARPDRGDRAQNSAMGVLIPRHRSSATARSSAGPWEGSSAGTSATRASGAGSDPSSSGGSMAAGAAHSVAAARRGEGGYGANQQGNALVLQCSSPPADGPLPGAKLKALRKLFGEKSTNLD